VVGCGRSWGRVRGVGGLVVIRLDKSGEMGMVRMGMVRWG